MAKTVAEESNKIIINKLNIMRNIFDETMIIFFKNEIQEIIEGINERNNCGRMAIYMEKIAHKAGFHDYIVDTEYNRKQEGEIKTIIDGNMNIVRINCDLILHSRGKFVDNDNLIAVEVKKYDGPKDEKEKDKARLCALTKATYDDIWSADGKTHPEHVCGYILGVFVELNRRDRICICEYYTDGKIYDKKTYNI